MKSDTTSLNFSVSNIDSGNRDNTFDNVVDGVKNGANNVKEIVNKAGNELAQKSEKTKSKLAKFFNFLGKAGVMIGTVLGGVAIAAVTGLITASLPVSLPVLGIIAGGLFLGGVIVKLVNNIKDDNVTSAWDAFTKTLKDVGSDMLMSIPRLIDCLLHPDKAVKYVKDAVGFLVKVFEDLKKDVENAVKIVKDAGNQISEEVKNDVNQLKTYITKCKDESEKAKSNLEDSMQCLCDSTQNAKKLLDQLLAKPDQLGGKGGKLYNVLQKAQKKISSDDLNKTFQGLNDSIDGKSQNSKSSQTSSKVTEREYIFTSKARKKIENDMDNLSLSGSEISNIKNLKNAMETGKSNNVKSAKIQLKSIQEAFSKMEAANILKKASAKAEDNAKGDWRNKPEHYKDYNQIAKNLSVIKGFVLATKKDSVNVSTLFELEQETLQALNSIEKTVDNEMESTKLINKDDLQHLSDLKTAINDLKIDKEEAKNFVQHRIEFNGSEEDGGEYVSKNLYFGNYQKQYPFNLMFASVALP